MHLNKILEQIKRHQSPSEAIDKLSTALEKHEGSLLEKGFTILKSELAANMYEAINGPHFDEEHARYAVAGDCNVIKAISDCCCTTQRSIDAVNLNLTQMNADNRLSICQQTNTLQNAITSGYSLGTVVSVSKPYDEPVPPTQFPMPMQNRRKLVDLVISCDGEQRKLSVSEDKTMMTDSSIGLTIATEKSQIVNMVRQSLEDCRVKKESLSKIDEEMRRCEDILKILNVNSDITTNVTKDFKELDELRAEVKELKQLLQNISTVRPEENNIDPPTEEKENEI